MYATTTVRDSAKYRPDSQNVTHLENAPAELELGLQKTSSPSFGDRSSGDKVPASTVVNQI